MANSEVVSVIVIIVVDNGAGLLRYCCKWGLTGRELLFIVLGYMRLSIYWTIKVILVYLLYGEVISFYC